MKAERQIDDSLDFESYCEDQIDELIQSFHGDKRFTYDLDPEEDWALIENGASFGINQRGMRLVENLQRRYFNLGEALFPNDAIEIRLIGIIEE